MTEQRFDIIYDCQGVTRLIDRENKLISLDFGFDLDDLTDYEKDKVREWLDLLNEQQATNDYLEESNSRLQIQLGETLRLVDEQQATIRRLQDLCGESDSENAKLRIENKKLKAKLKEKEEDERLYANEIVKLNKEAKEVLDFKSLGGNY